ncbi:hypothetical protein [Frigoriglobus tundricola]|uniref:HEAT repeat domain-containing protein n=1 Tax=Frigoriglobus tundricola TaxID=2774151 RepID=A0A6M5YPA1_9BACT|nr:hypothetical protein [Frigoriglobus tundricola]QJW95103.1 hypothetical protein FTUN_2642 [Frigoriglobus tundricola]
MLRWDRTAPLLSAALAVALAVLPVRATDDETTRALSALKSVTKEGKGNEDAGPAWKTLVSKGGAALMPALEAFDDTNPTATNWLRAAVDAIAEKETTAGHKLPVEKLEAFAKDTKHAPSARRVAYELLVSQDATAKDRLLPGFLNDKSADLRRDAVARELGAIEKAARPSLRADLEKLFAYARDKDQVDLIAKKIGETGGAASVSEHFGFVTHAAVVGPFDSTGGKGFATAYPPEAARDASGTFKGKGGAEVKWVTADTTDKYGKFDLNRIVPKGAAQDRYTDAVAYALAVVVAEAETPCEIRVASATAVQIFLNGKKLFEREEYHHGDALDANIGRGVLKKGENVIVLKVCQNSQDQEWARVWSFQMRVCDETGGPLPLKQKITADNKDKIVPLGYIPDAPATKEEKK